MSLFSPSECSWGDEGFQGAFKLNYDNRWGTGKVIKNMRSAVTFTFLLCSC